jgi:hypothetical protein
MKCKYQITPHQQTNAPYQQMFQMQSTQCNNATNVQQQTQMNTKYQTTYQTTNNNKFQ